jgi:NADH:ubiquinone oxidoreductase subunit 6 (subunit J)
VTTDIATDQRVLDRRARFRDAVVKLSERAQSAELVKLLLFPGAVAVVAGFGVMILGWYGASHTARTIEQIPYLISGGLIGLGLVMVGALLLSSAVWMTMLQRHQAEQDDRLERRLDELEERLAKPARVRK